MTHTHTLDKLRVVGFPELQLLLQTPNEGTIATIMGRPDRKKMVEWADRIVRAVNSHDALLAALEESLVAVFNMAPRHIREDKTTETFCFNYDWSGDCQCTAHTIRAAIAAAKGEA